MCALKEFRRQIREIASADMLPDYALEFDAMGDRVVFRTRDGGKRLR